MPDEMHKLQKQPAEGSRKVIERELERQETEPSADEADKKAKRDPDDGKRGEQNKRPM